jgi:hypothetical protein
MTASGATIRAREIRATDIAAVGDFLASGFRDRPLRFWLDVLARLGERTVPPGLPKYGYLLESAGAVVGAVLLIFSELRSGGKTTIRCNVSSWFVAPAFRSYASLFVSKALSLKNVTYLNVTPAPHTLPMVRAQGYSQYSSGLFVALPALQFRSSDAGVLLVMPDDSRAAQFDASERQLLLEHAKYGCLSLWCIAAGRAYPFVFRLRTFKRVVPCAQLIYCRAIDDFVQFAGPLSRFLAWRGRPFVVIDANAPIPGLVGKYLDARQPKYFKGPDQPRLGDLVYTETAMFGV